MRILVMGPPGSGKGTQGKIVAESLKIPHISAGDIFRQKTSEIKLKSEELKLLIRNGHLFPDSFTNSIILKRLECNDCAEGYILDGYPRTLSQAEAFDIYLTEKHQNLDHVVILKVSKKNISDRILNRRFCKSCGSSFNVTTNPSKIENICDYCNGSLLVRDDDNEEIILDRIKVYEEETRPLIEFYNSKGITCFIAGGSSVKKVTKDIAKCLERNI